MKRALPLEVVRDRLAAHRRAGVRFDEAWPLALERLDVRWREALGATREEWRAAYERRDSRLSVALCAALEELDVSGFAVPRGRAAVRLVVALPDPSVSLPSRAGMRAVIREGRWRDGTR